MPINDMSLFQSGEKILYDIPQWQIYIEAIILTIGLFIFAKMLWMLYYEWKEKDGGINYLQHGKKFFKR